MATEKSNTLKKMKGNRKNKRQKDDFKDILKLSEKSLAKDWLSKEDEIWDEYLKD